MIDKRFLLNGSIKETWRSRTQLHETMHTFNRILLFPLFFYLELNEY